LLYHGGLPDVNTDGLWLCWSTGILDLSRSLALPATAAGPAPEPAPEPAPPGATAAAVLPSEGAIEADEAEPPSPVVSLLEVAAASSANEV